MDIGFYRDINNFQGGHLKVWDYFNHCKSHPEFNPKIAFSENTTWSISNPWNMIKDKVINDDMKLDQCNAFFIAGVDWDFFLKKKILEGKIVINLIQGFSHIIPTDKKFQYLSRKAIRICVSNELREQLLKTNQINGPLFTISNGIDAAEINYSIKKKEKVLVVGYKEPLMAIDVYQGLIKHGICNAELLTKMEKRNVFLQKISESSIVVFLPFPIEGFFLPALEAMFFDTLVVCPDCVGNRSFCLDGYNCLLPDYSVESIVNVVKKAYVLPSIERTRIIKNANKLSQLSYNKERKLFHNILDDLESIWRNA